MTEVLDLILFVLLAYAMYKSIVYANKHFLELKEKENFEDPQNHMTTYDDDEWIYPL